MMRANHPPPDWQVSLWFNADGPLQLGDLRGRVVLVHAFQMFCPGCVQHALPQAERTYRALAGPEFTVIGLHTVFEHHESAAPDALAPFLREHEITHPVGVDQPGPGRRLPKTMSAWALRGTPSLVLVDRAGRLRLHRFGRIADRELRQMIDRLMAES